MVSDITSSLEQGGRSILQLMLKATLRLKFCDNNPTCFVRASAAEIQSCMLASSLQKRMHNVPSSSGECALLHKTGPECREETGI